MDEGKRQVQKNGTSKSSNIEFLFIQYLTYKDVKRSENILHTQYILLNLHKSPKIILKNQKTYLNNEHMTF